VGRHNLFVLYCNVYIIYRPGDAESFIVPTSYCHCYHYIYIYIFSGLWREKKYIHYNSTTVHMGTCRRNCGHKFSDQSWEKSLGRVCVHIIIYYIMLIARTPIWLYRNRMCVCVCVCDVLDIIIVITAMMVSSCVIFDRKTCRCPQTTAAAATDGFAGNSHRIPRRSDRNIRTVNHIPCLVVRAIDVCTWNNTNRIFGNPSRSPRRSYTIRYPPTPPPLAHFGITP